MLSFDTASRLLHRVLESAPSECSLSYSGERKVYRSESEAMKEDILEQLVDDYLKFNGFFTAHNVKFKPTPTHPAYITNQDSVASDIDVIGFHPMKAGLEQTVGDG
jgi:hypothetical protein